jgi:hypothetical protein
MNGVASEPANTGSVTRRIRDSGIGNEPVVSKTRRTVSTSHPSLFCRETIHCRIYVLLILACFSVSTSSASNRCEVCEITSITNVLNRGRPFSSRHLSTWTRIHVNTPPSNNYRETLTSLSTGCCLLAHHESLYVWICRRWPINVMNWHDVVDKARLEKFHKSVDPLHPLRQTLQHIPIILFR